jgi:hypothetical protein
MLAFARRSVPIKSCCVAALVARNWACARLSRDRLIAGFPLVVGCNFGGNVTAAATGTKLKLSRGFEVMYCLLSGNVILCSEAGVISCRSVSRA